MSVVSRRRLKLAFTPAVIRLALLLALAAAGQYALRITPPQPLWIGLGLYAAAVVVFIYELRQRGVVPAPAADAPLVLHPAPAAPPRLGLWLTAFALTLLTVQGVLTPGKTALFGRLLVVVWIASLLVYSGSVFYASGWFGRLDLRGWWRLHRTDVLIALAFAVAAFLIRNYDVVLHPYAFINDEGEVGKEALRLLSGERTNFFDVAWASQPVWAFLPAALSVQLFGNTAWAVRLVGVLQGSLTVALVYLIGREWFNRVTAALAAGVLLALPFHVHFSRLGVNNVGDAFFSTLALWLTYRAVRRGTPVSYLVAGLAVGSAFYTYLGSRLAVALVAGSLIFIALRGWGALRRQLPSLAIFLGALIVTAAPIGVYFYTTPDQFYARLNTEGIINNGYLLRQAAATGQGVLAVLADQFSRSSLVYLARPALAGFYNSPEPYLPLLGAIFFVLGLGYTFWRLLDPRYMTLAAWFWSVVILGSTMTMGPPSSQRLLMSAPALALLVAVGLERTASLFIRAGLLKPRAAWAACAAVVAVLTVQGLVFYFGPYRQGHYFEDPSNEFSYEVAVVAAQRGPDTRVFLLGDPSVYASFGDFLYLADGVEVTDYNTVTLETLADLPHDKAALFVAVPSRIEDLRLLTQWLPGGEWREVPRRYYPADLAYVVYDVPASIFDAR